MKRSRHPTRENRIWGMTSGSLNEGGVEAILRRNAAELAAANPDILQAAPQTAPKTELSSAWGNQTDRNREYARYVSFFQAMYKNPPPSYSQDFKPASVDLQKRTRMVLQEYRGSNHILKKAADACKNFSKLDDATRTEFLTLALECTKAMYDNGERSRGFVSDHISLISRVGEPHQALAVLVDQVTRDYPQLNPDQFEADDVLLWAGYFHALGHDRHADESKRAFGVAQAAYNRVIQMEPDGKSAYQAQSRLYNLKHHQRDESVTWETASAEIVAAIRGHYAPAVRNAPEKPAPSHA